LQCKIKAAMRRARLWELYLADKKEKKDRHEAEQSAALPLEHPHLIPVTAATRYEYGALRKNIAADLKHYFPNTKFSIHKRHYDCVNIGWTDGVSSDAVTEIKSKWVDHVNDWSGDFRDYDPSIFNGVFGGIKYLFTNRSFSEAVESARDKFVSEGHSDSRMLFMCLLAKTDLPKNISNVRVVNSGIDSGLSEDYYKLEWDVL